MKFIINIFFAALIFKSNILVAEQMEILDIRLGVPLNAAKQRLEDHFDGRVFKKYYLSSRFENSTINNEEIIFVDGVLFVANLQEKSSRDKVPFSEMVIVFYDKQSEEEPIIAVSRILGLDYYSISIDDMELGMIDKYGQPGTVRNWDISGTDYMWSSDIEVQKKLQEEPKNWKYIRNFQDICNSRRRYGGFNFGSLNENWRDEENNPLKIDFFFSSKDIHAAGVLERQLTAGHYSYLKKQDRLEKIKKSLRKFRDDRRQCGEILFANIDLWRRGGPGSMALFLLYDHSKIIDIYHRWSRESEQRKDSNTRSSPIDF